MSKILNRNFLASCIFVFIAILFSCTNITTPKKITIQADPEIQASLGKIDVSLTDYFSVEKIQEMLGENQDISIYDYKHNENDETMRFLVHKDFAVEIPGLNPEEKLNSLTDLESLSFGYEEDGITPATLFSIPEINQTIEIEPISLEFSNEISGSIKNEFSSLSFNAVEPGSDLSIQNQSIGMLIELCDDEFDSLSFGNGTELVFSFKQLENASPDLTAKINYIAIADGEKVNNGKIIDEGGSISLDKVNNLSEKDYLVSSDVVADLVTGEGLNISLDMAGKTIPKEIGVIINVTFEGGSIGKQITIKTSETKFNNMNISKVTGFNTINPIVVDFPALNPIDLSEALKDLKGAVIGSDNTAGQIFFNLNLPEGIESTTTLSLTQDSDTYQEQNYDGLKINDKTVEGNKISLAEQKLNTKPINFSGSLSIKATDATIDFTQPIGVSAEITMNKFEEIYLLDSLIPTDNLTQEISTSLGEISQYVSQITFNEVGLALNLCNGLPFDAEMKLSSDFLNITDKKLTIEGNQISLPSEPEKITSGSKENPLEINIDESTNFDLSIDLSIPSSNGVITLENISTGTDYKFYGQVELIIDWKSLAFKLPEDYSGFKGSFPNEEEGREPLDLSTFTQFLGNDLSISGITPKLYISSDLLEEGGPFAGAELTGSIKVSYVEKGEEKTKFLLGGNEKEQIRITKSPELIPDENSLIIDPLENPSLSIEGLTDILFSGASDIKFEYDIQIGNKTSNDTNLSSGILIEKESLDKLSESSEIKLGMFIDLPIIFTVKPNEKGYASFDIMSLMQNMGNDTEGEESENPEENESSDEKPAEETDLLNREPGAEIEGLSTVFDYIENASIILKYTNNTGIALNLVIEDTNSENQKFSKALKLGKGKGTIELKFDEKDAQYIQNTNPFYPDKLELQFPGNKTNNTDYKFLRNASLDVTLQGKVKTDIDYTIDLENTKTEGEF